LKMRMNLAIILALMLPVLAFSQNTQIKGFANVDLNGTLKSDSADANQSFVLGQYDLFITSQVTEDISFLGETVFEYEEGEGFVIDVERVVLKYDINDHYSLSMGKFHSPLGYWNNRYHHGTVLQPTIGRPSSVAFEDERGILPIHETGAQFNAENFGAKNWGLNLAVSNGIAGDDVSDWNNKKSLMANLHFEPKEDFKVFFSSYYEKFNLNEIQIDSDNSNDSIPSGSNRLMILNTSAAYMSPSSKLEFIAEYFHILNSLNSEHAKKTQTGLFYAGYKLAKITPYLVYDFSLYDIGQSYLKENNSSTLTFGLRHQFNNLSVVKLEYYLSKNDLTANAQGIKLQFAIGF
jgi:hypothetical protein